MSCFLYKKKLDQSGASNDRWRQRSCSSAPCSSPPAPAAPRTGRPPAQTRIASDSLCRDRCDRVSRRCLRQPPPSPARQAAPRDRRTAQRGGGFFSRREKTTTAFKNFYLTLKRANPAWSKVHLLLNYWFMEDLFTESTLQTSIYSLNNISKKLSYFCVNRKPTPSSVVASKLQVQEDDYRHLQEENQGNYRRFFSAVGLVITTLKLGFMRIES